MEYFFRIDFLNTAFLSVVPFIREGGHKSCPSRKLNKMGEKGRDITVEEKKISDSEKEEATLKFNTTLDILVAMAEEISANSLSNAPLDMRKYREDNMTNLSHKSKTISKHSSKIHR